MPGVDYAFGKDDFALLLIRKAYPERTDGESAVIRAFLLDHLHEFDAITFGKRVGHGATIDPTTMPAVQRATKFSTQLRIDIVAMRGPQPIIIEVKQRLTPASLGQILTYRLHYLEDRLDSRVPELWAVGRESDPDTIKSLTAHDVTVFLYPDVPAPAPRRKGGL